MVKRKKSKRQTTVRTNYTESSELMSNTSPRNLRVLKGYAVSHLVICCSWQYEKHGWINKSIKTFKEKRNQLFLKYLKPICAHKIFCQNQLLRQEMAAWVTNPRTYCFVCLILQIFVIDILIFLLLYYRFVLISVYFWVICNEVKFIQKAILIL